MKRLIITPWPIIPVLQRLISKKFGIVTTPIVVSIPQTTNETIAAIIFSVYVIVFCYLLIKCTYYSGKNKKKRHVFSVILKKHKKKDHFADISKMMYIILSW